MTVIINKIQISKWYYVLLCVLFFLYGCFYIIKFYNFGNYTLTDADWHKDYYYMQAAKEALSEGKLPFHMNKTFHSTNKYFSSPETIVFPDLLLLRWINIEDYWIVHHIIAFIIGYWGIMLIAKKYKLIKICIFLMVLLFNFHGYLLGRLQVGHGQWISVLMMPLFVYGVLQFFDKERASSLFYTSISLFLMLLYGGLHVYNCCLYAMGFIFLMNVRQIRFFLILGMIVGFLSLIRFLPALQDYLGFDGYQVGTGYPTIEILLSSLVLMNFQDFLPPSLLDWSYPEYDIYIGPITLCFIIFFLLKFYKNKGKYSYQPLLLIITLVLLSFSSVWMRTVYLIDFPLIQSTRIPTRIIIVPILFAISLAVIQLSDWITSKKRPYIVHMTILFLIILQERTLQENARLSSLGIKEKHIYDQCFLEMEPSSYEILFLMGSCISGITFVLLAYYYYSNKLKLLTDRML